MTLSNMVVEMWPIERPIEYARNARKITQAAVDILVGGDDPRAQVLVLEGPTTEAVSLVGAWEGDRVGAAEGSSPACSARTRASPTSIAHWTACLRAGSCSAAIAASSPAFIFSHTRGTEPKLVGRTSPRVATTSRTSEIAVTCVP